MRSSSTVNLPKVFVLPNFERLRVRSNTSSRTGIVGGESSIAFDW